MPLYEYLEASGRIVERVLPVQERNRFPGRLTVPRRVNVCPRGAPTVAESALRGFYGVEQTGGLDEIRRECEGLEPDQIKSIWEQPETT